MSPLRGHWVCSELQLRLYFGLGDALMVVPGGMAFLDVSLEADVLHTTQRQSGEVRRTKLVIEHDTLSFAPGTDGLVQDAARFVREDPPLDPELALVSFGHRACHLGVQLADAARTPRFLPTVLGVGVEHPEAWAAMAGANLEESIELARKWLISRAPSLERAGLVTDGEVEQDGSVLDLAMATVAVRGVGSAAFAMGYDAEKKIVGFGPTVIDPSVSWVKL